MANEIDFKGIFKQLASQAADAVQEHLIRFDAEKRILKVSQHLISPIATRALRANSAVQSVRAVSHGDAFSLSIRLRAGLDLWVKLVPRKLEISSQEASVFADLPEGFRVKHDSGFKNFLIRLVDLIFGLKNLVARRFGVKIEGTLFSYTWPFSGPLSASAEAPAGASGTPSWVGKLLKEAGVLLSSPREIPLSYREHWLEIDLSQLVPAGFPLDKAALSQLISLLRPEPEAASESEMRDSAVQIK